MKPHQFACPRPVRLRSLLHWAGGLFLLWSSAAKADWETATLHAMHSDRSDTYFYVVFDDGAEGWARLIYRTNERQITLGILAMDRSQTVYLDVDSSRAYIYRIVWLGPATPPSGPVPVP